MILKDDNLMIFLHDFSRCLPDVGSVLGKEQLRTRFTSGAVEPAILPQAQMYTNGK
jgi:hypothetical protein